MMYLELKRWNARDVSSHYLKKNEIESKSQTRDQSSQERTLRKAEECAERSIRMSRGAGVGNT